MMDRRSLLKGALGLAGATALGTSSFARALAPVEPLTKDMARDLVGLDIEARGFDDYRVICDETNNPPMLVDAKELRVDIIFKRYRYEYEFHLPITVPAANKDTAWERIKTHMDGAFA
jgi:hypothetical protein